MSSQLTTKKLHCWVILLLAAAGSATAQEQDLTSHIEAIKTIFQQLDSAAQTCVESSAEQNTSTQPDCAAFATQLEGNILTSYLEHCTVLRNWREELVAQNGDTQSDLDSDDNTLQAMIDVEFTCGEAALLKRTSYVASAYNLTQPSSRNDQSSLQLRQLQNERSNNQLRNSSLHDIENSQQRLSREIQQQWNRIELDNLRQQNARPIDFGTRIQ